MTHSGESGDRDDRIGEIAELPFKGWFGYFFGLGICEVFNDIFR